MSKVGWALIIVLIVTQLVFALELMELASFTRRIGSIDEETALMRNEAAAKDLESEKIRNAYYRTLMNGLGED